MIQSPAFAYAQARIQARFAALAGEPEWQRLAGMRTLSAFVEEARLGPLRPWVKGLSGASDPHELERGLRALAWDLVDEVATWVPGPWQGAVAWVGWLAYLPVLEQAARGAPLPGWVAEDYRLRPLLGDDGRLDPMALARAGAGSLPVAGSPGSGRPGSVSSSVAAAWLGEWRRRRPRVGRQGAADLRALERSIGAHLGAFRAADPADAWTLRRALRERLRLRFHRQALGPVPIFCWLALALLDLERLRGELLRRALAPLGAGDAPVQSQAA
jgi:hypothetical protein